MRQRLPRRFGPRRAGAEETTLMKRIVWERRLNFRSSSFVAFLSSSSTSWPSERDATVGRRSRALSAQNDNDLFIQHGDFFSPAFSSNFQRETSAKTSIR